MHCGYIRGKRHRWLVVWEEHSRKVYIREADAVFLPRVEYVGRADTPREALSKADAHINFG